MNTHANLIAVAELAASTLSSARAAVDAWPSERRARAAAGEVFTMADKIAEEGRRNAAWTAADAAYHSALRACVDADVDGIALGRISALAAQ